MAEREERPHREQVAAVLAALDVPEVARRRPRGRHVAEEADRVDVEVDLRVGRREPGPLREREREGEGGERRDEGPVTVSRPHGGAEDTVPARMRRPLSLLAAAALLILPTAVAFSRGGYFDASRVRAGIAACLLAALAAAVAERPLPATAAGRVAVGGLAALTGWSALSLAWAPLAGPAADDLERLALYLAALVAAAALLGGRAGRWTEPALLAGCAAAAAYGLSERLLPGSFELARSAAAGDRLAQPLTYWNAQGALAALGLVLAAGTIAAGARARAPAVAGSLIPLLGLDLYLTLSRGALGALAAGLLVLVALTPTRAALAAAALVVAGAALPAALAETALDGVMRAAADPGAGAAMLAVLVAGGAACALLAVRLARGGPLPRARPLAVAGLVAALSLTVARRHADPRGHADHGLAAARVGREQPLLTTGAWPPPRSPTGRCAAPAPAASASSGCCAATGRSPCATPTRSTSRRRPSSACPVSPPCSLCSAAWPRPRGAPALRPPRRRSRPGPCTPASIGTGRCRRSRSSRSCSPAA